MNREVSKKSYSYLSNQEKEILKELFANGLRKRDSPLAHEAVRRTGLSMEKVMSWVYSQKRKDKGKPKRPLKARLKPPTAYHIAMQEVSASLGKNVSRARIFEEQAKEWKKIKDDPAEYQKLQEKAQSARETFLKDQKERTPEESCVLRKKLLRKACALADEFERNGFDTLFVIIDAKNLDIETTGSKKGEDFIEKNPYLSNNFYVYCTGQPEVQIQETLLNLRKKVSTMWNNKYAMALQRPGARIPYQEVESGKIHIKIFGSNVALKKTCYYRRQEMEDLLNSETTISMKVERKQEISSNAATDTNSPVLSHATSEAGPSSETSTTLQPKIDDQTDNVLSHSTPEAGPSSEISNTLQPTIIVQNNYVLSNATPEAGEFSDISTTTPPSIVHQTESTIETFPIEEESESSPLNLELFSTEDMESSNLEIAFSDLPEVELLEVKPENNAVESDENHNKIKVKKGNFVVASFPRFGGKFLGYAYSGTVFQWCERPLSTLLSGKRPPRFFKLSKKDFTSDLGISILQVISPNVLQKKGQRIIISDFERFLQKVSD